MYNFNTVLIYNIKLYNRELTLLQPLGLIRLMSVLFINDWDLIIDHIRYNL